VTEKSPRSDAQLWADLVAEFRAAGVDYPDAAHRHARRAVALVRREYATSGVRTFAPGETIPYDVDRAYDLDGEVWERQATDPTSTLRESWRMPDFNPDEHESACREIWTTPYLLDEYGPLTELPAPHGRDTTRASHG